MPDDQEQKESIITAATTLFARFGLEKTTMMDIAKAAKKGKSSLYYYFKSKEQVFAEVIRHEIGGLKAAIVEAIQKEEDPRDQFRNFIYARLDYLNEKADQYIAIKDEYLKHYAFIEQLTMDYSNWEISIIESILARGQRQGIFEINHLGTNSKAIFLALKSLEYPWTLYFEHNDIEKSVDGLIRLLLKGIQKR